MSQDAPAGAQAQGVVELRQRMAVIKKEVAAEVEAKWVTPYRTPEVFDLKVNSRLAAHREYRSLQDRVREADAARAAEATAAAED